MDCSDITNFVAGGLGEGGDLQASLAGSKGKAPRSFQPHDEYLKQTWNNFQVMLESSLKHTYYSLKIFLF